MAYDEGLAERIRGVLDERLDVAEKRMFGGIAFMVRGHMCVGIVRDDLMVRVGPDAETDLLREPHARRMDFTGRPLKGFLYVGAAGLESDAALERWIGRGLRYATSLPAKAEKALLARPPGKRAPARRAWRTRGGEGRAARARATRQRPAVRRRRA